MTTFPVSYVEINSPEPDRSQVFLEQVFGWDLQPFADPSYRVAPHGERAGVDAGLLPSRDGQPRVVPVIRVDDLADTVALAVSAGATVVVPPFQMGGLGAGCYLTDPAGVLIGLHHYNAG
jgi:predicted enzyme related to lactoylglutathione lyase